MPYKNNFFIVICSSLLFYTCHFGETNKERDSLAEEEIANNWIPLFTGNNLKGWRGFNRDTLPASWIIEDDALKSLGTGGDTGGDIIYGLQEFENFELSLDWKIVEGGNSGIFYHVVEGEKYSTAYENAPEYQLIDDTGFPEFLEEWQKTGADYAMYVPIPAKKKLNLPGNWNQTRIIFSPQKVEHWLNGEKILEFVPWSEDWEKRKMEGKWKDYPDYGISHKGFIGLQDHGSYIWFRHIRVRVL